MDNTSIQVASLDRAYAHELQDQIYRLTRTFTLVDQVSVGASGVTVAQTYTLLAFPPRDELTMQELSERMNLAGSTMTRMIDRLVEQGLVARTRAETDRRVVRVSLTDRGRETRAHMEHTYQELFARLSGRIDPHDREPFLRALRRVIDALAEVAECC